MRFNYSNIVKMYVQNKPNKHLYKARKNKNWVEWLRLKALIAEEACRGASVVITPIYYGANARKLEKMGFKLEKTGRYKDVKISWETYAGMEWDGLGG